MNFELVRDIAAIVDGIPTERFHLDEYQNLGLKVMRGRHDLSQFHSCGALGCVGGWMSMHPKLGFDSWWSPPQWVDQAARAIGGPFDSLNYHEAAQLFSVVQDSAEECEWREQGINDKVIFGRRVIRFLGKHGQTVSPEYYQKYFW